MSLRENKIADPFQLESFREYLRLLVAHRISNPLRHKVDLSGIVQETLWEAHQALEQGQQIPQERRAAWLREILANNVADALRRCLAGKRDALREMSFQEFNQSSQRLDLWLAREFRPDVALERDEQWQQTVAALWRLPESQREAIILSHCDGLPLRTVAERLGRSREAVAGLVKRGLKQLRAELIRSE